jgi:hypothetical protein
VEKRLVHRTPVRTEKMRRFRPGHAIATAAASAIFGILLFPSIVDTHGVPKSALYVALGIAAIWGIYYFLWGAVWRHFYNQGREDERKGAGTSRR